MCIIVVQPIGKSISRKTLETCFYNNPDGTGYMFTRDKKLIIKKGYFTFDSFYHNYKIDWIMNGKLSPFILHFRIATHGNVDRINCHPHQLKENLAFVHNGVFSSVKPIKAKVSKSDTLRAAIIFKQLPDNWFYCKSMKILVEDFFKANSSYGAFMDNTGQLFITDKKSWVKKNKILYSNGSFEDREWNFVPYTEKNSLYEKCYNDCYDNKPDNYDCFQYSTPD